MAVFIILKQPVPFSVTVFSNPAVVALCDYEQQIQVVVLSQTVDRIGLVDFKMEKILNKKELWSRSFKMKLKPRYYLSINS